MQKGDGDFLQDVQICYGILTVIAARFPGDIHQNEER